MGGAVQFPWELQQMLPLHGLNETFTCRQQQKRPEAKRAAAAIQPLTEPQTWHIPYSAQATWEMGWPLRPLCNFQYGSYKLNRIGGAFKYTPFSSCLLSLALCLCLYRLPFSSVCLSLSLFRWKIILIYSPMSYWLWPEYFLRFHAVQLQQLSTLCESLARLSLQPDHVADGDAVSIPLKTQ